jgi:cobalt/nickel transport system ATP-binding protein
VFQDPDHQVFSSSIYQEIAFGPLNFGWPKEEVKKRVEQVIKMMKLEDLKDKPTHYLSYGQKKQVAIASILVLEPEIIILDEPTAGLDPMHTKRLLELLDNLVQKGITLIIATHDVNFAYSWADRVHVMKKGKVIKSGSPEEIFVNEDILEATDMEMPYLLALFKKYNEMSHNKLQKIPKTDDELIQMMKGE